MARKRKSMIKPMRDNTEEEDMFANYLEHIGANDDYRDENDFRNRKNPSPNVLRNVRGKNKADKVRQLKNIKTKHLNDLQKRQRQAAIEKATKGTPLKQILKKYALRSLPAVGTLISLLSPKPAGAGSDKVD